MAGFLYQPAVANRSASGTRELRRPAIATRIPRGNTAGSRREAAPRHWHYLLKPRVHAQVTAVLQELATLLGAGLPLLDALDAIESQYRGELRGLLHALREQIAAGAALTDAMRQQPHAFDEMCICMADVGERTGSLEDVLGHLTAYRRRSEQMKGGVFTALIYPAIVLCAGIGVALFISTCVVPRLLETLVDAGRPLPMVTQVVKAGSDLLLHYGWLLAAIAAVGAVATVLLLRHPRICWYWHRAQLRLPILGQAIQKQGIVRLAVMLAILSRSGVEFVQALQLAGNGASNLLLRSALQAAQRSIAAGRDIGPALAATNVFPAPVVRIVELGQRTGRLDTMLERLAEDYDRQVQMMMQRFVSALEPAMILLLAALIGVIVLAVILPYMEAGNAL